MRGALLRSDGRARNGLTWPGRSALRCYRRGLRVAPVVTRVVNDVICHSSTRGLRPASGSVSDDRGVCFLEILMSTRHALMLVYNGQAVWITPK